MSESRETIKSYGEMRLALIEGAKKYNKSRLPKNKSVAGKPGLFHGEKGRVKGIKLEKYAEYLSDQDERTLLALAFALFDSSSTSLAIHVAAKMIAGEKKFSITFLGKDSASKINTLGSEVFSAASIRKASHKTENNLTSGVPRHSLTSEFHKRSGVCWLLKEEIKKLNQKDHKEFNRLVKDFKKNLRDTRSEEIDKRIIPGLELSDCEFTVSVCDNSH